MREEDRLSDNTQMSVVNTRPKFTNMIMKIESIKPIIISSQNKVRAEKKLKHHMFFLSLILIKPRSNPPYTFKFKAISNQIPIYGVLGFWGFGVLG